MYKIPKFEDRIEALRIYLETNRSDNEGDSWTFGHNPTIIYLLNSLTEAECARLHDVILTWDDRDLYSLADPIAEAVNPHIDGNLEYCRIFLKVGECVDLEYLIDNLPSYAYRLNKKHSESFYDALFEKAEAVNKSSGDRYSIVIESIKKIMK